MVLQIKTTHFPATDLGYLLHKNPARMHVASFPFGKAALVYSEATESSCAANLILEVDPVGLVRGASDQSRWDEYVNDRPYVASSFISAALRTLLGTAMTGRSKERPELATMAIPFEIWLPAIRCQGGEAIVRALFEPLGYSVQATALGLDPAFPEWGDGDLYDLKLSVTMCLSEVLKQLYVLIPVLDNDKHYWVGADEIDKLLSRGEGWLADHPEREEITRRYMLRQARLTRTALDRLNPPDEFNVTARSAHVATLHEQRLESVASNIRDLGVTSVLDLGCGDGKLLRLLLQIPALKKIVGMDVSTRALSRAKRALRFADMSDRQRDRVSLIQGSLIYIDDRLNGFESATLVEVIEHLDLIRLAALAQSVFGAAKPRIVIVTTPNQEYNTLFPGMVEGALRHDDHRFEWSRQQFSAWCDDIGRRYGYEHVISGLGEADPVHGAPTQMAVFKR